jgi:hypothetical protein
MKIIGVNGLHTWGEANTDLLLAELANRGHQVLDFNYPQVWFWRAGCRREQQRIARLLVDQAEPGDIVVAHSYGCLVALRAMELGARFSMVFFFSAAMNQDFTFPYHGTRKLVNTYNPADKALWLAKLIRWWDLGRMGSYGYAGPPDESGTLNHSHYFRSPYREQFADMVNHWIVQEA